MYTVYTKDSCPQCEFTKARMKALGIDFIEIKIEDNPKVVNMLKNKSVGSAPAIFKGATFLFSGFRPDEIKKLKE